MKKSKSFIIVSMFVFTLMFAMSGCSLTKQEKSHMPNSDQKISQSGANKDEVMVYEIGDEDKLLADWEPEQNPLSSSQHVILPDLPEVFNLTYPKHKNLEFDIRVVSGELSARFDIIFPKTSQRRIPIASGIQAGEHLKFTLKDYAQYFNPKGETVAFIIKATKNGKKDGATNTIVSYTTQLVEGSEHNHDECGDDHFCSVDLSKEEIFFEKIPLPGNTERDIATAFGMQDYLSTVKNNTNGCCDNPRTCLANNRGYRMFIPKYGIKIFSSSFTKDNIKKENFIDDNDVELDPRSKGDSYTPSLSIHRILSGETFVDAVKRNRPEWENGEQPSYWDGNQRQKMGIVKQGEYQPVLMHLDQETIRTYSGARLAPEPTPLTGFDTKIRKPWYVRFGHNINTANPDSFKIFQYGDMLIFHLKSHPEVFFSIYHHYVKPQSPTCPEFLFDSIIDSR